METNGYKDDMMEIDKEEQRKQTCMVQSPVDLTKAAPNSLSAAPSPEVKKFRNNETPTAHTKAKALFHTPSTGTQNKPMSNTTTMSESSKTVGTPQLAKAPLTGMFDCWIYWIFSHHTIPIVDKNYWIHTYSTYALWVPMCKTSKSHCWPWWLWRLTVALPGHLTQHCHQKCPLQAPSIINWCIWTLIISNLQCLDPTWLVIATPRRPLPPTTTSHALIDDQQ